MLPFYRKSRFQAFQSDTEFGSSFLTLHQKIGAFSINPCPRVGNQPRESWFLSWLVGFLVGFWLVFLTNHHQPRIFEVGFFVGWFGWLVFRQFLLFFGSRTRNFVIFKTMIQKIPEYRQAKIILF